MSMNQEKLRNVTRKLAIEAGHKIMEVYNSGDIEVALKADESPVTLADQVANDHILAGLQEAFPDTIIITEEEQDSHTLKADTLFIVDPLDGTKEFIHKRGDFTVNIAYVVDNVPIRGVVYAPDKNRLFYTDVMGATVEEFGDHLPDVIGETKPISVSNPDEDALIVVASKSHRDAATDDYISQYNVADSKSAGSSLKFCLVATGEADLYPRLGRTMEWDTAAGHAVLTGAGGRVVNFDNHQDLAYGKPDYANSFFIAYSPKLTLIKG